MDVRKPLISIGISKKRLEPAEEGSNMEPKISNTDTIIHMLNGNIGPGVLAIPDAIKNSGLVVGSLGLVLMATMCIHCMHILVNTSQELCKRTDQPFLKFSDMAEASFATSGYACLRHE